MQCRWTIHNNLISTKYTSNRYIGCKVALKYQCTYKKNKEFF